MTADEVAAARNPLDAFIVDPAIVKAAVEMARRAREFAAMPTAYLDLGLIDEGVEGEGGEKGDSGAGGRGAARAGGAAIPRCSEAEAPSARVGASVGRRGTWTAAPALEWDLDLRSHQPTSHEVPRAEVPRRAPKATRAACRAVR